VTAIR